MANNFLARFAGRSDARQQPDGQAARKAMTEKYLNFSMQRRCIVVRKLNGMVMMPNQDPHEYLIKVFKQWYELEYIGESLTEVRILYLLLKGLSDNYEPIRFAAK